LATWRDGDVVGVQCAERLNAVVLAVFATLGVIVLRIPLGFWASRRDPQALLLLGGIASILLLALLPAIVSV
jgi:hypothetical protein